MRTITDRASLKRALRSPIDNRIKQLLKLRRDQLGGDIAGRARFIVVEASDTAEDLERELGFPVLTSMIDGIRFGEPSFAPNFEFVLDLGFAFELPFILTDDGYAHVALIIRGPGADSELLALCAHYAAEHA